MIWHMSPPSNTCSCCSFMRSPLCFFLIGGILSSSPLSLRFFFWCSSQANSVLVFSLRAFWRSRKSELWCCSLTSSSFMYWRTMSIVNWEKLSCPPEKAMLASWNSRRMAVESLKSSEKDNTFLNKTNSVLVINLQDDVCPWNQWCVVIDSIILWFFVMSGLFLHSSAAVRFRWEKRAEGSLFNFVLCHGFIKLERVLCCHWHAVSLCGAKKDKLRLY